MNSFEKNIRSFVRNAYMMSSVKDIQTAVTDSMERNDYIKARFLLEMAEECKNAKVKSFCDLPL